MTRDREFYIPVVSPSSSGGPGLGGVGAMFAVIGLVLVLGVLVLVLIEAAYPAPKYAPVPAGQCAPFSCATTTAAAPTGGPR